MKTKKNILFTCLFLVSFISVAQNLSTDIRLNQLGFLPNSVKIAAVVNAQTDSFKVMTSDMSDIIFEGELLPSMYYSASDENVRLADFTLMTEPGKYVLVLMALENLFLSKFQRMSSQTWQKQHLNITITTGLRCPF